MDSASVLKFVNQAIKTHPQWDEETTFKRLRKMVKRQLQLTAGKQGNLLTVQDGTEAVILQLSGGVFSLLEEGQAAERPARKRESRKERKARVQAEDPLVAKRRYHEFRDSLIATLPKTPLKNAASLDERVEKSWLAFSIAQLSQSCQTPKDAFTIIKQRFTDHDLPLPTHYFLSQSDEMLAMGPLPVVQP